MARLQDVFLHAPPAPPARPAVPRSLTAAELTALRGIGDPRVRASQDMLGLGGGVGFVETPAGRFSAGDTVEFVTPYGVRTAGVVHELTAAGALVNTIEGAQALVPVGVLMPGREFVRAAKREAIRAALRTDDLRCTEACAPATLNDSGDTRITLQGWSVLPPTETEAMNYMAAHYPGAQILDATWLRPSNRCAVVIRGAAGPANTSGDVGLSQEFVGDEPTTPDNRFLQIGAHQAVDRAFTQLGAALPGFQVQEDGREVDVMGVTAHFTVTAAFLRAAAKSETRAGERAAGPGLVLSHVLRQGSVAATGRFTAMDDQVTLTWNGPTGDVHTARSDLHSPVTNPHEDAPGAYEHGSWVARADAPPAGEVLGGPGLSIANMRVEADTPYDPIAEPPLPQAVVDKMERGLNLDRQIEQMKALIERAQTQGPSQIPALVQKLQKLERARVQFAAPMMREPPLPTAVRGFQTEAVDETARAYYRDYYDEPETEGYGERLTHDIDTRACIAAAWHEAGRAAPTADELTWAVGILEAPMRYAAPAAGARVADDIDDLAKNLIGTAEVSGAAKAEIQQLVGAFLAKADPAAQKKWKASDPAVISSILPAALREMKPRALSQLRYKFNDLAPGEKGPGWLSRKWNGLDPVRQQTERAHQVRDLMAPPAGAPPGAPVDAPPEAPAVTPVVPAPMPVEAPPAPPTPPAAPPAPQAPARTRGPGGKFKRVKSPNEAAPAPVAPGASAPAEAPAQTKTMPVPTGLAVFDSRGNYHAQPPAMKRVLRNTNGQYIYVGEDGAQYSALTPDNVPERWRKRMSYQVTERGDATHENAPTYHDVDISETRQPATGNMYFTLANLRRSGDYIVGDVAWDADRTQTMAAKNIENAIITFVKGEATRKSPIDLGHIGRVRVRMLDVHAGIAEVLFRSSEGRVVPPTQISVTEGMTFHEPLG